MRTIVYMARKDPGLLVGGLVGAGVVAGIYAACAAVGFDLSKLFN